MEFLNIYKRLSLGENVSMTDAVEFVSYVAKIFNPNAAYNESYTVVAFQNGFGSYIIKACLDVVRKNPNMFKIQTTDLFDKSGYLIKTYFQTL